MTAVQHRNFTLRDSLVSGIRSYLDRARLLELDNTKSVDDCFALANAIDLSLDSSKSYRSTPRSDCLAAVKGHKGRVVIDYSETVNLFTDLDAYPFPDVEQLLNQAASYRYFSKLDFKFVYHQIPIRVKDRPFTAFQVGKKLYQFTPFGITNVVPAFQRIMDSFIERNKLKVAEAYLDDIYIGGETQADHDQNVQDFLGAAEREGLV